MQQTLFENFTRPIIFSEEVLEQQKSHWH